jgi:hypothetical protein
MCFCKKYTDLYDFWPCRGRQKQALCNRLVTLFVAAMSAAMGATVCSISKKGVGVRHSWDISATQGIHINPQDDYFSMSQTTYFFSGKGNHHLTYPLSISRIATIQWYHFVTEKMCKVDRVTAILPLVWASLATAVSCFLTLCAEYDTTVLCQVGKC